jgi:hypothetical protein
MCKNVVDNRARKFFHRGKEESMLAAKSTVMSRMFLIVDSFRVKKIVF